LNGTVEILSAGQPASAVVRHGPRLNRSRRGGRGGVDVWDSEHVLFVEYGGPVPHTLMAQIMLAGGVLVEKLALLKPALPLPGNGFGSPARYRCRSSSVRSPTRWPSWLTPLRITDMTLPRQDDEDFVDLRALAWSRCRHPFPTGPIQQPLARRTVTGSWTTSRRTPPIPTTRRPVAGRDVPRLRRGLHDQRPLVLESRLGRVVPDRLAAPQGGSGRRAAGRVAGSVAPLGYGSRCAAAASTSSGSPRWSRPLTPIFPGFTDAFRRHRCLGAGQTDRRGVGRPWRRPVRPGGDRRRCARTQRRAPCPLPHRPSSRPRNEDLRRHGLTWV